jgi:hypothetical protein
MRNVSAKSCGENQNTHFMFSIPPPKIVSFMRCGKMSHTPGKATDDNSIRRMRFACWITKATDTPTEYVILIAFPRQQTTSAGNCLGTANSPVSLYPDTARQQVQPWRAFVFLKRYMSCGEWLASRSGRFNFRERATDNYRTSTNPANSYSSLTIDAFSSYHHAASNKKTSE